MRKNKAKKQKNTRQRFYRAFIVMFIGTVVAIQMGRTYKTYKEKQAKLREEVIERDRLLKKQEELIRYEEYTKTDEYTEITAEEKLGMTKDNWIIFKEKK
jgi:hypothetical protein